MGFQQYNPRHYHSKWCMSERQREIPYVITSMWNLKHDTNELIHETETDSQIRRTSGCQWGEGGGRGKTGVGDRDRNC